MAGTTVILAKSALVDLLPAALPTGFQVQYEDNVDTARKLRVYLGNIEEHEGALVSLRGGLREENYTLTIFVEVNGTKGAVAAETVAIGAVQAIETLLADDPKLATATVPPGIVSAVWDGFRMFTTATNIEHRVLIEGRIQVKARLLP